MYALFTDTDTDITPEVAAHYGMKLISMPYEIDGKEVFPYVDFDKFEPRPFYDKLRSGVMPKTSALNPEIYKEYFEQCYNYFVNKYRNAAKSNYFFKLLLYKFRQPRLC